MDDLNLGVRERLNRSGFGILAGLGLILIAIGIAAYYMKPTPKVNGEMAFYSDDDGQTFFEDSAMRIPPFDHNGKTAYEAAVFKNTKGNLFVAFLRRYIPDAKEKLDAQYADDVAKGHTTSIYSQKAAFDISGTEVKVRGSTQWIPQSQELSPPIKSPDGDTYNEPVDPK